MANLNVSVGVPSQIFACKYFSFFEFKLLRVGYQLATAPEEKFAQAKAELSSYFKTTIKSVPNNKTIYYKP